MFAKLKKKVQEEIGAKGEVPTFGSAGPGLASPVKLEAPGSLVSIRDYESPTSIASSTEDLSKENGTEDKTVTPSGIHANTEKIKGLQAKVSDLAITVRDKNRQIDKLENALEKHQDQTARKIQEMNEQYQASRARMSEEYQQALQKKNEEIKKNNGDLLERLRLAEDYRDKYFKREEENDEMAGFATQELAKVKHMLLNAQEELYSCKAELLSKDRELEQRSKQMKNSDNEVQSLMEQISSLTTRSEDNEDENIKLKSQMKEKDSLQRRCEDLSNKFKQSKNELNSLRENHADLQNEHQTLLRNTDLHRNKTSNLIEEKDEEIGHLKERLAMLEKRLQDGALSGDERFNALEGERNGLEKKLAEAREQLNQVKSSWSDKITSLENQIAKLNSKIAEDAADFSTLEKQKVHLESLANELKRDLERAQSKLKDDTLRNDSAVEDQKQKYVAEIAQLEKKSFAEAAKLTERVSELETDLSKLKKVQELEKVSAHKKIEKLQNEQGEWLEKEIDAERKITSLETELERLKKDIGQRQQGQQTISSILQAKDLEIKELTKKVFNLDTDVKTRDSKLDQLHSSIKKLQTDYHASVKEKDDLMLRNAQLSQEFETHKLKLRNDQVGIEKELQQKAAAIAGLEQSIQDLQSELLVSEQKVKDLTQQHTVAMSALESEELDKLRSEVKILEDQVLEKTKTIKMQQQRLTDLKKTLQRELKVQALPNDDIPESMSSNGSYGTRSTPPTSDTRTNNVPTLTPSASVPSTLNSLAVLNTLEEVTPKHMIGYSPFPSNSRTQMLKYSDSSARRLPAADDPFADCRDVNFQYLKHVVMKFLLSQESESVKLIKAIAMLLQFSTDEQKLVKETLEWKMSWFGAKPKLGKGQMARIIPPPY